MRLLRHLDSREVGVTLRPLRTFIPSRLTSNTLDPTRTCRVQRQELAHHEPDRPAGKPNQCGKPNQYTARCWDRESGSRWVGDDSHAGRDSPRKGFRAAEMDASFLACRVVPHPSFPAIREWGRTSQSAKGATETPAIASFGTENSRYMSPAPSTVEALGRAIDASDRWILPYLLHVHARC